MKISLLLRIFGVFLVFTTAALAQNQKPTVEDEQVLFNVTVTTKKSDWIIGLKSENFKVYDEKNLQPITFFSSEDVPISVGILVDKSQSTDGILAPAIRQALSKFVNKSHSDDEYFLMTFNVTQELLLDNIQDKNAVLQAIEKLPTIKSQGNTSYYDAIRVGLEKVSKGKYTHKVLIILSDGMNNESKIDFGDIKKIIKQSDVLLYNINLTNSSDAGYSFGMQALAFSEELVGLSGGHHPLGRFVRSTGGVNHHV